MIRVVAALTLAGCSDRAPTPSSSGSGSDSAVALPGEPVPPHSVWRGLYQCAQGTTGLTLTIDLEAGVVSAVFEFAAVDATPDVPPGSYRLGGTMTAEADGRLAIDLVPTQWIVQPPAYVMVGISARSNVERTALRGQITHPSCSTIELRRVLPDPKGSWGKNRQESSAPVR